jgi:hypothetical protein
VLTHVVDGDDVLVTAVRQGLRLAQEASPGPVPVARHELDGHAAAELDVAGEIDHAHTAAANLADELVFSRGA